MDVFDCLTMLGGLCMFLLGMNLMSTNLEQCAGKRMSSLLLKFTGKPIYGFLLGLIFTVVIQSSSATTAMVVGFVSAGMMTLQQSVGVILGANLGTTITAWMISLTGLQSDVFWIRMLKPTSFSPLLALVGIILVIFSKNQRKKEIGMVFLGFAVLMFGIETMSGAVSGLKESPEFRDLLTAFSSPITGVLVGTAVTAIIQSSSASVGILQALCSTGIITYKLAIPIILGMNFGACVTALIASLGTSKDAKRTAMVHLLFNLIGKTLVVVLFYVINLFVSFPFMSESMSSVDVAMVHTLLNLIAAVLVLPFNNVLVRMTKLFVRSSDEKNEFRSLDDHLLSTPAVALNNCETAVQEMAMFSINAMEDALMMLRQYEPNIAKSIRDKEELVDRYEDRTGSYLIKISAQQLSEMGSSEAAKLLRLIGDFERISDHAVNLVESAEEMLEKKFRFTPEAEQELAIMEKAVSEILDLALKAFRDNDAKAAAAVEPLEQVVDNLRRQIRLNHTLRLQQSKCTLEHGFILSDILTNLERVSDHCSNVAGCVLETMHEEMDMHRYLSGIRSDNEDFSRMYRDYTAKYSIPEQKA